MTPTPIARVDLHCHSTASQQSRLGVQRALGLPECATPPEEVYELAKRRGMDFVTITDHDTIDGVLSIADRPDVFVSVELTASFKGEPQQVHVLCFGLTPDDHEWLQAHGADVEECAAYLHGNSIACALAHPFYAVAAPLAARHRRRLARLFPIWETRNGARAPELNLPAATYVDTHGGAGVGGSDDHAGIDVGRTWTETGPATTSEELLRYIRRGECHAAGDQGSAEKWAHVALALAARVLGDDGHAGAQPDPRMVWSLIQRTVADGRERGDASGRSLDVDDRGGDASARVLDTGDPGALRGGALDVELHPRHARALLEMWVASVGIGSDPGTLLERMQADDFRHEHLARRARRAHERLLAEATEEVVAAVECGRGYTQAAGAVFGALVPAIPYAPATAFLAGERRVLAAGDGGPSRVAVVADGLAGVHGVTRTLAQLRERGVPGFEVEVIGTDATVDRRLPAVAEVDVPFYPGLRVGVPSVPATVEALADGRYDLVHLCSPGPAGVAAALIARTMELPLIGSYHTELGIYAGLRSGEVWLRASMDTALASLYDQCQVVLSPSEAADASVRALGIDPDRIVRWDRGVDTAVFDPCQREEGTLPGELTLLYAGRLAREKGLDLLVDAYLDARAHDPRLHLVLAGDGPERDVLAERLGAHATFLGSLGDRRLARAYASADLFVFPSSTDTFGQVVLEAQASGLPVLAVGEGGPATLIDDGRTGRLCPPDAAAFTRGLCELADSPVLRRRLADAALADVRERSWECALERLADGYRRALHPLVVGGATATTARAA